MSAQSTLPVVIRSPAQTPASTVGGFLSYTTQRELGQHLVQRRSIFDRIDTERPATGEPIITVVVTTLGVAIHVAGAPTWHSHANFARDLLRISHETGFRAFRLFLSEEYTENVKRYAYASSADHGDDSITASSSGPSSAGHT